MDEHRYGLISHQCQCWGMRRVRPHAPYRTRYEWVYLARPLDINERDEAFFVFLPCVSKETSRTFLQAPEDTDSGCIHVVSQDQAGLLR